MSSALAQRAFWECIKSRGVTFSRNQASASFRFCSAMASYWALTFLACLPCGCPKGKYRPGTPIPACQWYASNAPPSIPQPQSLPLDTQETRNHSIYSRPHCFLPRETWAGSLILGCVLSPLNDMLLSHEPGTPLGKKKCSIVPLCFASLSSV